MYDERKPIRAFGHSYGHSSADDERIAWHLKTLTLHFRPWIEGVGVEGKPDQ